MICTEHKKGSNRPWEWGVFNIWAMPPIPCASHGLAFTLGEIGDIFKRIYNVHTCFFIQVCKLGNST